MQLQLRFVSLSRHRRRRRRCHRWKICVERRWDLNCVDMHATLPRIRVSQALAMIMMMITMMITMMMMLMMTNKSHATYNVQRALAMPAEIDIGQPRAKLSESENSPSLVQFFEGMVIDILIFFIEECFIKKKKTMFSNLNKCLI